MCIIFCLACSAEVHVGKLGSGIWGSLERGVCSLPPAWTGEMVILRKFSFALIFGKSNLNLYCLCKFKPHGGCQHQLLCHFPLYCTGYSHCLPVG